MREPVASSGMLVVASIDHEEEVGRTRAWLLLITGLGRSLALSRMKSVPMYECECYKHMYCRQIDEWPEVFLKHLPRTNQLVAIELGDEIVTVTAEESTVEEVAFPVTQRKW